MDELHETHVHPDTAGRPWLTDKETLSEAHRKITVHCNYWPYGWLRIPSIFLGGVGLLGSLCRRFDIVGQKLGLLNMPPETACYLIVAGSCILIGISMICKSRDMAFMSNQPVPMDTYEHWRCM